MGKGRGYVVKITNKLNLPQAFVSMAESDYQYKEKQYSVTTMLKGLKEMILERRYHGETEQDVADMIWMLFGQAAHHILEQSQESETEFKEEYLIVDMSNGYKLSGRLDLYCGKTKTVTDYKTCSVWSIIYQDFDKWKMQLLMYAWMLRRYGFECNKGEVVAIMKDHSKTKAKVDSSYPQLPVQRVTFSFTEQDFEYIDNYLQCRFAEIEELEKLSDNNIPHCSLEERWNKGNTYAVTKKGNKKAKRVLNDEAEAQAMSEQLGNDYFVAVRPGEDKKCAEYCRVNSHCDYWQKQMKVSEAI